MEPQAINAKYIRLLSRFGISLEINNVDDPELPKQEILEENGCFTLRLNFSKILPDIGYESYVAHNARTILLPRLALETERLILRRFHKEDAEDCFEFLSDRQSCHDDGGYEPFTEMDEEYSLLMEKFATQETRYMIVLKETNHAIGTINLWEDSSRAVEAMEIGYTINPSQRRKGYAFEAISAMIHLLQNEFGLDMMLGGAFEDNTASLHLLNKLGFIQEGIVHKAIWHAEKGPIDIIHFYRDR